MSEFLGKTRDGSPKVIIARWPDGSTFSRTGRNKDAPTFLHEKEGMQGMIFWGEAPGKYFCANDGEEILNDPDAYEGVGRRFLWLLDAIEERPARTPGSIAVNFHEWIPPQLELVVVTSRPGWSLEHLPRLEALLQQFAELGPAVSPSSSPSWTEAEEIVSAWSNATFPPSSPHSLCLSDLIEAWIGLYSGFSCLTRRTPAEMSLLLHQPATDNVHVVEEAEVDAWVLDHTDPGALTLDQEYLDLCRFLGEPIPFRLPFEELLQWALSQ